MALVSGTLMQCMARSCYAIKLIPTHQYSMASAGRDQLKCGLVLEKRELSVACAEAVLWCLCCEPL